MVKLTARQVLSLAATGVGRRKLGSSVRSKAWPLIRRVARLHRQTISRRVRIIAVTGSFGKSSTVRLIVAALGLPITRSIRINANGLWTAPRRVLELAPSQQRAVIEIGIDSPGQMAAQVAAIDPNIAVVTTVGGEHLETLGSIATVEREKSMLIRRLRQDGIAVLNGDDPRVRAMAPLAPGPVRTYGFGPDNDVRAVDMKLDWPNGTRFTVLLDGEARQVRLPMLGRPMVLSALAALTVASIEGIPLANAIAGIESSQPVGARFETFELDDGTILLCDHHKNSIESIRATLELATEIPGRKILVISRIRDTTDDFKPLFGPAAALLARTIDEIVVVGTGAEPLIEATRAQGFAADRIHQAAGGALDTIERLHGIRRPGDVILFKGRVPEKLDRIVEALLGRDVVCNIVKCRLLNARCGECPMLAVGFAGAEPFG